MENRGKPMVSLTTGTGQWNVRYAFADEFSRLWRWEVRFWREEDGCHIKYVSKECEDEQVHRQALHRKVRLRLTGGVGQTYLYRLPNELKYSKRETDAMQYTCRTLTFFQICGSRDVR